MIEVTSRPHSQVGLDRHGLGNLKTVYWNSTTPALYEEALKRNEGILAHLGPLVVRTGQFTGRSPNDKFVVDEPSSHDYIWWGKVNRPFPEDHFDELHRRMASYLQGKDIFVQDCWCGADPQYRMPVRIITQYAWHSLFIRNMFIQGTPEEVAYHEPEFTVLDCPGFHANPENRRHPLGRLHRGQLRPKAGPGGRHRVCRRDQEVDLHGHELLAAHQKVIPMHCSANIGPNGDTAIFFGLSGTGKTTLSADPNRTLIGDDEHGWSDDGVFNFEGGCYAKVIRLSAQAEPEIYDTTRRFGTILENVGIDNNTRRVDLDDGSLTENTRAAYPISHIPNAIRDGTWRPSEERHLAHRRCFRRAAAYFPAHARTGDVPLLSAAIRPRSPARRRVSPNRRPHSSACFGAPFMALQPSVYAELLGQKIAEHNVNVLAGQHRLDRRPVRRRQAHENRLYARHAQRRPRWQTR